MWRHLIQRSRTALSDVSGCRNHYSPQSYSRGGCLQAGGACQFSRSHIKRAVFWMLGRQLHCESAQKFMKNCVESPDYAFGQV